MRAVQYGTDVQTYSTVTARFIVSPHSVALYNSYSNVPDDTCTYSTYLGHLPARMRTSKGQSRYAQEIISFPHSPITKTFSIHRRNYSNCRDYYEYRSLLTWMLIEAFCASLTKNPFNFGVTG